MNTALENPPSTPRDSPPWPVGGPIILVLGLLASWLAAGSLGWLAPPLQSVLTWLAFAAVLVAALFDRRGISARDGLLLGGATLIAVLMTASSSPVVNVIAVSILLAAIAQVFPGPTARLSGPAALAAMALAVFRLVSDGSAAAWTFTNSVGHVEGLCAGWLTGRPLLIGASFGGLDFLALMAALTAVWLVSAPRPRMGKAAWAILLIFLAQTAYLVVLAYSHDLAALLPPQLVPKQDDLSREVSHLGIWTWGNAIRTLLPWNLPVLGALFHTAAAIAILLPSPSGTGAGGNLLPSPAGRGAGGEGSLLPSPDQPPVGAQRGAGGNLLPSPAGRGAGGEGTSRSTAKRRNRSLQAGALPGNRLNWANWRRFGPAGLMIVAAAAMTLTPAKPDLIGPANRGLRRRRDRLEHH